MAEKKKYIYSCKVRYLIGILVEAKALVLNRKNKL